MLIHSFDTGFIEVPEHITLNIYALGCKHNCPGCANQHLQNFNHPQQRWLSTKGLSNLLNDGHGMYDGVCFLGGDAAFQPKHLAMLATHVKFDYHSLFVCLYTGFEFNQLPREVVDTLDVVIDGKWRGKTVSEPGTNQKIWVKTDGVWRVVAHSELGCVLKSKHQQQAA